MHLNDAHFHLHAAAGRSVLAPDSTSHIMAPRFAEPAARGPVGDFGILANLTGEENAAIEQFTQGLTGVDQGANYLYANVLTLTLVGLCVLTFMMRLGNMGTAHIRHLLTLSNPGRQSFWSRNQTSWWPKIKQHLLYAPLFKVRHNREIQLSSAVSIGTLPSRFHTLLLTVYIGTNIAYCCVLHYKHEKAAILAELRGRSGELAILNMIPTILFALRNNPLIPILRVSFDTFNLLHRWAARVVTVEAIVHTAAYLANTLAAGGTKGLSISLSTSVSYMWGMVATVMLTLMVTLAFSPVRHAFYEIFINMHRVLALLAIIGTYIHIQAANLPQLPYLQLALAMWGFEWAARLYRIFYYNVSAKTGVTRVTVEALPAEACRVTFDLSRPFKFVPGSHVHAYLPSIGLWSSHPFSVAWVEHGARTPQLELGDVEMEKLPHFSLPSYHKKNPSTLTLPVPEIDLATAPKSQTVSRVSLVMRARTGMTRTLYNKAASSPTGQITMKGGLEGPYGGHESLSSYGTVILFAGGVGITHCVSYVAHLLREYNEGLCSTRKILLVWSVPNTEALEWARPWMDQILKMENRKEVLRIQLFITKPRNQNEVNSRTGTVQMFPGRCNPSTIVDKEVVDRVGAMGVVVCGPGAFADSVRDAVRKKVKVGSVSFIEEGFTY
ncbi:hypothetical protein M8818_007335 [Zalaria obscura]|uniref:Uncharacterized protein n=1 Tax=Zalaria obscura TaxID=2024903 RepID=A0ACC3S3W3_9PEZI